MTSLASLMLILALTGVTETLFGNLRGNRSASDESHVSDDLVRVFFVVAAVMPFVQYAVVHSFPAVTWAVVGTLVGVFGVALRAAAMTRLRGRYRMSPMAQPDHPFVVRDGCYRHVRHPGYAGLTAIGVGMALVGGGPVGLVWVTPLVAVFVARIRLEESILTDEFGAGYLSYVTNVRWKLVPHVY